MVYIVVLVVQRLRQLVWRSGFMVQGSWFRIHGVGVLGLGL